MGNKQIIPEKHITENKQKLIKELYKKYKKIDIDVSDDLLKQSKINREKIDMRDMEDDLKFKKIEKENNIIRIEKILILYKQIFDDLSTNSNEKLTFDIYDYLVTKGKYDKQFVILKYDYSTAHKTEFEKYYKIDVEILKYFYNYLNKNKILNQTLVIKNKESILYKLVLKCEYTIENNKLLLEVSIGFKKQN